MQTSARNPGRTAYMLSASLLCAYGLNVLAGMAIIKLGWTLPHAGDVAEFLVVFAAMVLFVIGVLRNEQRGTPPVPE
jgi:surface polysaccharide O-acyltransferase-like enzyme